MTTLFVVFSTAKHADGTPVIHATFLDRDAAEAWTVDGGDRYRIAEYIPKCSDPGLVELTAILGPDPVGKAKALVEQGERLKRVANFAGTTGDQLDEELQLADSAAEDAGFPIGSASPAEVIRKLATQCREADERAESLRAALAEKDALLAELTDADDWLRQLLAAQDRIKELEAETARRQARVAELEEQASMACQEPRDDCSCAGCRYADDVNREVKP